MLLNFCNRAPHVRIRMRDTLIILVNISVVNKSRSKQNTGFGWLNRVFLEIVCSILINSSNFTNTNQASSEPFLMNSSTDYYNEKAKFSYCLVAALSKTYNNGIKASTHQLALFECEPAQVVPARYG
jgi:hypothetical protein